MKTVFYKIKCLTNLHVGSGDVNYNIIDNEVEKDSVTGMPMIHASGIKGALRDFVEKYDKNIAKTIFGAPGSDENCQSGTYKFFDAHLISRPMRVSGSDSIASISVATVASINQFISSAAAFGYNCGIESVTVPDFKNNEFITNAQESIKVEGDSTGKLALEETEQFLKLENVLGGTFAIAKSFDNYALPVVARNYLENGISKNLWYEEVVPHGSVFYFAVMCPKEDNSLDLDGKIVQFGGHSSIGCGFTKITKLWEGIL